MKSDDIKKQSFRIEKYSPEVSKERKKIARKLNSIISDYLFTLEKTDFIDRIKDLKIDPDCDQLPKELISLSFDRNEADRKKVSNLIISLVIERHLTKQNLTNVMIGFISKIHDLSLDVPLVVYYLEFFVNKFIDNKLINYGDCKKMIDVLSVYSGTKIRRTIKKIVEKIFSSYFISEEIEECCREVIEINDPETHPLVIKYAISFSFDRGNRERELTSRFIGKVVDDRVQSDFIKRKSLEEGITMLLNCIEDLTENVPLVDHYLSFFLARAIYDESLAPAFLKKVRDKVVPESHSILDEAKSLIELERCSEELPKIWDSNVEEMKQIKFIVKRNVKEFFDVPECGEQFCRFLVRLGHPHYHYEVVYQLFSMLINCKDENKIEETVELINLIYRRGITTKKEIIKGIKKAYKKILNCNIDHPNTKEFLDTIKYQLDVYIN